MSSAFAATVSVEVRNVEKKGEMHLAIYDDANVFENDNGEKGGAAIGIVDGVIAFLCHRNYNNEMDKNLLGVPKEQYGFSNDAKGSFGPPSFKDASFTVSGDMKLEVNL